MDQERSTLPLFLSFRKIVRRSDVTPTLEECDPSLGLTAQTMVQAPRKVMLTPISSVYLI
ncbi:hypothetical protein BDQ17DRAFT_488210 [Cyathus striatus]|nr:hypothetical protein BDQ17DRAFT_488210 [Cyathus striatus]